MKRIIIGIIACLAIASCGGDGGSDSGNKGGSGGGNTKLVDPTGTWTLTLTYGTGNCGMTDLQQEIFTVTNSLDSYKISSSNPNQTFDGSFICTATECKLSGMWNETGLNASINASVDVSNKITGSGSVSATKDGETCTQVFTVTGTKS